MANKLTRSRDSTLSIIHIVCELPLQLGLASTCSAFAHP